MPFTHQPSSYFQNRVLHRQAPRWGVDPAAGLGATIGPAQTFDSLVSNCRFNRFKNVFIALMSHQRVTNALARNAVFDGVRATAEPACAGMIVSDFSRAAPPTPPHTYESPYAQSVVSAFSEVLGRNRTAVTKSTLDGAFSMFKYRISQLTPPQTARASTARVAFRGLGSLGGGDIATGQGVFRPSGEGGGIFANAISGLGELSADIRSNLVSATMELAQASGSGDAGRIAAAQAELNKWTIIANSANAADAAKAAGVAAQKKSGGGGASFLPPQPLSPMQPLPGGYTSGGMSPGAKAALYGGGAALLLAAAYYFTQKR